jgi:hypothetical protein
LPTGESASDKLETADVTADVIVEFVSVPDVMIEGLCVSDVIFESVCVPDVMFEEMSLSDPTNPGGSERGRTVSRVPRVLCKVARG